MIVRRARFIEAVFTGEQPVEIARGPVLHGIAILVGPCGRSGQKPGGVHGLYQVPAFDDADSAAAVFSGNRLGEIQIGIHPGRGVQEPNAQDVRRMLGVGLLAGEIIGQRERLDGIPHQAETIPVVGIGPCFGIHFAIVADVRQAVGFVGIRPEIRRGAHVVMLVATHRHLGFLRDGGRLGCQSLFGVPHQSIEGGLQRSIAVRQTGFHFRERVRADADVLRSRCLRCFRTAAGENERDKEEKPFHLDRFRLRNAVARPSLETLATTAVPVSWIVICARPLAS